MTGTSRSRHMVATTLVLAAVMLLFEVTPLDMVVQDRLFDAATGGWMVDAESGPERVVFYTGPKVLIVSLGIGVGVALAVTCLSSGPPERGRRLGIFLSCLVLVPVVLSGARNFTDVYCPNELVRYGGDKVYVKLFEAYPETGAARSPGRCFPAGHAGGGFALMVGFFVLERRRIRWLALAGALTAGWTMGLYQMLKGAHFLSHTIASMCGAWLLILIITSCWNRWLPLRTD